MKLRMGQALHERRPDESGVAGIVLDDKDEQFACFGHDSYNLQMAAGGGGRLGVLPTYTLILSRGSGDVQASAHLPLFGGEA